VALNRTFTQYLLHNDLASMQELEDASQAAVLYGGRLGTAAIELGLLTPEQLDVALAKHHGLPEIPHEWLERPDAGARAALHVDLIKRHRAFPLNFEKRSLHVGMVDPRNEAVLDDLAFASGCLIVPYALAEFRFVQLMQRVYGIAPSNRFKNLLDEGKRARSMRARDEQRALARAKRKNEIAEDFSFGPLAADLSAPADEAVFTVMDSKPMAPAKSITPAATPAPAAAAPIAEPVAQVQPAPAVNAPAAPPQPALEIDTKPHVAERRAPEPTLEQFEATVNASGDRSAVIEAALALGARFAEVVALFVLRDGVAAGLEGARAGKALELDATVIPLSGENALASCYARREPQRTLPSAALDKLLAKAFRSSDSTELAVFPVAIGERVVNLLVAQPREGELAASSFAALSVVAKQLGDAYARLIRESKQKAMSPAPAASALAKGAPQLKASIGALPLQKRVVKAPTK
jgi:hypothetical protein